MALDKERELSIISDLNELYQELTGNKEIILTTKSRINESIGLTSLGIVQFVFMIEEHFDVEIPNTMLHSFRRIGDVVKFIRKVELKKE